MTPVLDPRESQSDLSAEQPEKPAQAIDCSRPRLAYRPDTADTVLLVKRCGRFLPRKDARLSNSRLRTAGLLELANSGDLPANVFNSVPVPIYAAVLMAIGGTVSLVLSIFAFKDARLSWYNVLFLRQERRALKDEEAQRRKEPQPVGDLDILLDVNFRELWSETIYRCGMDVLMGCGAVLVGVGTLLAIDGADRRVWFASNLLSGYIGNAPLAIYGLICLPWSIYLWRKSSQQIAIARRALKDSPVVLDVLEHRRRNLQLYWALFVVTNIVGGAASLVTATRWEGYVVLAPIIVLSMFCNSWWRRRLAYDRPFADMALGAAGNALLAKKIEFAVYACELIKTQPSAPFDSFGVDSSSLSSVLEFMIANDLFKTLCLQIMNDGNLSTALFPTSGSGQVKIEAAEVLTAPKDLHPGIVKLAQKCLNAAGPRHFQYRQAYLAETLGSSLRLMPGGALTDSVSRKDSE